MRFARPTILAGGAALLLAGTAAAAAEKLHTMHVALPDGSVAQIEYAGDVARPGEPGSASGATWLAGSLR